MLCVLLKFIVSAFVLFVISLCCSGRRLPLSIVSLFVMAWIFSLHSLCSKYYICFFVPTEPAFAFSRCVAVEFETIPVSPFVDGDLYRQHHAPYLFNIYPLEITLYFYIPLCILRSTIPISLRDIWKPRFPADALKGSF